MIAEARLRNIIQVITVEFNPKELPLSRFLNQWFKKNRQMGSRDRKILSSLLYDHYRTVHLLEGLELSEKILAARFLLHTENPLLLTELKPDWVEFMPLSFHEKLDLLGKWYPDFKPSPLFPYTSFLSQKIDTPAYTASYLVQPDLFIRIRTGYDQEIVSCLNTHELAYTLLSPTCVQLDNLTRVDFLNAECPGLTEVQDYSSQACRTYLDPKEDASWWDCCAGAGGKSLLLADMEPNVRIYASDYRQTVLDNLRERMMRAGQRASKIFQADLLTGTNLPSVHQSFDGILLDAPCTGSGTWARTPEMLAAFDPSSVERFAEMQYTIGMQVIPFLKAGAPLIYITCSVFSSENELLTARLVESGLVKLEKQEYLKGYDKKADTMFISRLIKI